MKVDAYAQIMQPQLVDSLQLDTGILLLSPHKSLFARFFVPTPFASDCHPRSVGALSHRQLLGLSAPSTGKAGGAFPLTECLLHAAGSFIPACGH
jgi:hypothetical protein